MAVAEKILGSMRHNPEQAAVQAAGLEEALGSGDARKVEWYDDETINLVTRHYPETQQSPTEYVNHNEIEELRAELMKLDLDHVIGRCVDLSGEVTLLGQTISATARTTINDFFQDGDESIRTAAQAVIARAGVKNISAPADLMETFSDVATLLTCIEGALADNPTLLERFKVALITNALEPEARIYNLSKIAALGDIYIYTNPTTGRQAVIRIELSQGGDPTANVYSVRFFTQGGELLERFGTTKGFIKDTEQEAVAKSPLEYQDEDRYFLVAFSGTGELTKSVLTQQKALELIS